MLRTNTLVRFGAGQTGAQILRDTPAVLLPIFMTAMLGVPAWMAGVAILVPKLWVIFCDPLVGARSDAMKARLGRTPFLLAGALLASLGFTAMFVVSDIRRPWWP